MNGGVRARLVSGEQVNSVEMAGAGAAALWLSGAANRMWPDVAKITLRCAGWGVEACSWASAFSFVGVADFSLSLSLDEDQGQSAGMVDRRWG
jgi:hypothetical protein